MQRRSARNRRSTDIVLLSGWLFADLLLALAVIFLVSSNTIATRPAPTPTATPRPTATPTPTATPAPTATPIPAPVLKLDKQRITLTINSDGLLSDSQAAIDDLKQQIRGKTFLQNRTAGLVIVNDGAPDSSGATIARSQTIDGKVIGVLKSLGSEGFVFTNTSYYDTDSSTNLYTLPGDSNTIVIDLYLFQ